MELPDLRDHPRLRQGFGWNLPARYNIGVDVCDRWAGLDPDRIAVLDVKANGVERLTYADLRHRSNRLASALRRQGVEPGDRVAVLLPQGADVAVAHVAIYKLGAVALPLAAVFGPDGLAYRLGDSGAVACITDAGGTAKLATIRPKLPDLRLVLSIDGDDGSVVGLHAAIERETAEFQPLQTGPTIRL